MMPWPTHWAWRAASRRLGTSRPGRQTGQGRSRGNHPRRIAGSDCGWLRPQPGALADRPTPRRDRHPCRHNTRAGGGAGCGRTAAAQRHHLPPVRFRARAGATGGPGGRRGRVRPNGQDPAPRRLTPARVLLVACPQFVFERIELRRDSRWEIDTATETWLLVIEGAATIGPVHAAVGEAVFLERDRALVTPGAAGMTALVGTLAAAPVDDFLTDVTSSPPIEAHV